MLISGTYRREPARDRVAEFHARRMTQLRMMRIRAVHKLLDRIIEAADPAEIRELTAALDKLAQSRSGVAP